MEAWRFPGLWLFKISWCALGIWFSSLSIHFVGIEQFNGCSESSTSDFGWNFSRSRKCLNLYKSFAACVTQLSSGTIRKRLIRRIGKGVNVDFRRLEKIHFECVIVYTLSSRYQHITATAPGVQDQYAMLAAAFSSLVLIVKTPLNRQSPVYLHPVLCYNAEKQSSLQGKWPYTAPPHVMIL